MTDSSLPTRVGGTAPSWVQNISGETDKSLERVKKHRKLSRLRIVQGATPAAKARIKEFGEGSVIMIPGNTKVAAASEPFEFVPLIHFSEFCCWSDRDDSESDMILGRSFDEASEIAMKSKDKNRREEEYGSENQFKKRYVEHLCFPGLIYSGPYAGTPVTVSFEKGEYGTGENFCTAATMRKVDSLSAPLHAQVWKLWAEEHANSKFSWWGFGFGNPDWNETQLEERHGFFVSDEEYPSFAQLAAELEQKYAEDALEIDRSDAAEDAEYDVSRGDDL